MPKLSVMRILKPSDIPSSETTPESLYSGRREFLKRSAEAVGAIAAAGLLGCTRDDPAAKARANQAAQQYGMAGANAAQTNQPWRRALQPDDSLTPWEDVTTYNNFYEFGSGKGDPADDAKTFETRPWSVVVEGLVKTP